MAALFSTVAAVFAVATTTAADVPAPTLLWSTKISCSSWGWGCWTPFFYGIDSSPTVLPNGLVVVGAYKYSTLFGLNATDGTVAWSLEGPGGEDSPKPLGTDVLAWGGLKGTKLTRVDATVGKVRWEWTPSSDVGAITTAGGVSGGLVFAGTANGKKSAVVAINITDGTTAWTYAAGGEMWGTLGPAVLNDSLVCVGVGGSANMYADCESALHCLNRNTGALVWKAPAGKQIQSRPSVGKTNLFVGDYDYCVYALAKADGAQIWKTCTGGIVEGSTTVAAGPDGQELVLVPSFDGYVHALDGATGATVWKVEVGKTASTPLLSLDGKTAYSGGPDGLWAYDVATGGVVWKQPTPAMVGSSPALSTDGQTVFVGCEDGLVYAVSTRSASAADKGHAVSTAIETIV